jgi:hypothetical protein
VDPLVDETGEAYAFTNDDPLNETDPLGLVRSTIEGGYDNCEENDPGQSQGCYNDRTVELSSEPAPSIWTDVRVLGEATAEEFAIVTVIGAVADIAGDLATGSANDAAANAARIAKNAFDEAAEAIRAAITAKNVTILSAAAAEHILLSNTEAAFQQVAADRAASPLTRSLAHLDGIICQGVLDPISIWHDGLELSR